MHYQYCVSLTALNTEHIVFLRPLAHLYLSVYLCVLTTTEHITHSQCCLAIYIALYCSIMTSVPHSAVSVYNTSKHCQY